MPRSTPPLLLGVAAWLGQRWVPGDPGKPLVPGRPCSPLMPRMPGKPVRVSLTVIPRTREQRSSQGSSDLLLLASHGHLSTSLRSTGSILHSVTSVPPRRSTHIKTVLESFCRFLTPLRELEMVCRFSP